MENQLNVIFRKIIKFSIAMLVLGLFLGILTRELSRVLEKNLDYERLIPLQTNIMLSHGHAILIGAVLPLLMLFITWLVRNNLSEKDLKSINIASNHIIIGAVLTLALMVYKKVAFIFLLASNPQASWDSINSSLFAGLPSLRIIAHTLAHPLMAVGFLWWLLIIYKKMKTFKL